jgi:catechol 2,3-dioxygenase-like lactoylglutathione lyase family enzyme
MTVQRILTNLCSDDLPASRDFYVALLDMQVSYDGDWYVQLKSSSHLELELELGIIQRSHALLPKEFQNSPNGMYVTFVVADVDAIYQRAKAMKLPILQEPKDEFYGQRRFLLTDPNGCLVDVCSPWHPSEK